jgi:glycosyltransferase involved in cell wall biosynthesis
MKTCLYFESFQKRGGGANQFLRSLSQEFNRMGYELTNHPDSLVDVMLINTFLRASGRRIRPNEIAQVKQTGKVSWLGRYTKINFWKFFPRKGPAIVHRLDGIPRLYRGHKTQADDLQLAINSYVDYTIFQSAYAQKSFINEGINPAESCIIYNGVNPAFFYPKSKKKVPTKSIKLLAVSWSSNPSKGFALLARISKIPDVNISFVGNWCPTINAENVNVLGPKEPVEIAEIMRSSDAMVHAGENEACSNAILEALACGLPVLYLNAGGNPELAGKYGVALTEDLAGNIDEIKECYKSFRELIIADRSNFLINRCAREYLVAFEKAILIRRENEYDR